MNLKERVNALNTLMLKGKIDEAFEQFYHPEVVRQENHDEPRIGKAFNWEYEKKAIAKVDEWHAVEVRDVALNEEDQVSMVVQFIEVTVDGKRFKREEVSVQKWQDGLIIYEKFYYSMESVK